MSHFKFEYEQGKQKKINKKGTFLQKKPSPSFHGSIGDNTLLNFNTRRPIQPATGDATGSGKLPYWHYLMEQAFENFLLHIDDIFIELRKKNPSQVERCSNFKVYQDICVKLRMEVLIALDKLELLCLPGKDEEAINGQTEFFHKMNDLKGQLSQLRWLYHNAIKDLDIKFV